MNLSTSGLLQSARQDVVLRQLHTTANGGGIIYDPTSKARVSNHETDKQAEENATWFFEYRALLNSKLTTLTTSLTSAYTTDLDASLGAQSAYASDGTTIINGLNWGRKNAMQGNTGQKNGTSTVIDPGGARSAFAYFKTFGNDMSMTSSGTWDGTTAVTNGNVSEGTTASLHYSYSGLNGTTGNFITGSTTFLTGGKSTFELDELVIDVNNTANNFFFNSKQVQLSGPGYATTKQIGNQLELTLYKFFAKPENLDILRFGLFENVFVVGTSSLPTGSQVQGSIKLNYDSRTGRVMCTQERYAAFFHS